MQVIRTPEERFENLKNYPFEANYVELPAGDGTELRMHYLDEGQGEIILCMHGQPSWSYLYRKMIPVFVEAGYRVIAPDLIGFGKSDKPVNRGDYTYASHVFWMKGFIESLNLTGMTIIGQDWGSLIGFRLVAENVDRFARVVASNGGLPDAKGIPDEMAPHLNELLASTPALPAGEMFARLSGPMEDRPQFMYWVRHTGAHLSTIVMTTSIVPGLRRFRRKTTLPVPGSFRRLCRLFLTTRQFPPTGLPGRCSKNSKSHGLQPTGTLTR